MAYRPVREYREMLGRNCRFPLGPGGYRDMLGKDCKMAFRPRGVKRDNSE